MIDDDLYVGWVGISVFGKEPILYSYSAKMVPNRPDLLDASTLCLTPELLRIFEPIRNESYFMEKLRGYKQPYVLTRDLQNMISELGVHENSTIIGNSTGTINNTANGITIKNQIFASIILQQITDIGWNHFESMNTDMTKLTLSIQDKHRRKHIFDVFFDNSTLSSSSSSAAAAAKTKALSSNLPTQSNYPFSAPRVIASLPIPVVMQNWPSSNADGGHLNFVLATVKNIADHYIDLLDILSDIDTNCCVLEPRKPTYSITSRRIALEYLCSICIDFPDSTASSTSLSSSSSSSVVASASLASNKNQTQSPYNLCGIRFLGPPEKLLKYQKSLQENAHLWSTASASTSASISNGSSNMKPAASSVRENIERVLSTKLPRPNHQEQEQEHGGTRQRKRKSMDTSNGNSNGNGTDSNMELDDNKNMEETGEEVYVTECGICYSFTTASDSDSTDRGDSSTHNVTNNTSFDGSSMPDIVCPNANCSKMYHRRCLVEWLHAVPTSKSSFGTIFGSCPYCNEWLSVKSTA